MVDMLSWLVTRDTGPDEPKHLDTGHWCYNRLGSGQFFMVFLSYSEPFAAPRLAT